MAVESDRDEYRMTHGALATESSIEKLSVTGITGGHSQNVIAAGIIHGDVNVRSGDLNNLEGKTQRDVDIWTKGMVEVSALAMVMKKLENGQKWITITGNAGEGKTTLGYMVMKSLRDTGCSVYRLEQPNDYFTVTRERPNSVIMLNDVFGAFTFDVSTLQTWQSIINNLLEEQEKSQGETTRVLFVSRRNVLEGAKFHLGGFGEKILNESAVVDLSTREDSDGSVLQDRLAILEYHLSNGNVSMDESTKRRVAVGETPHGFPHCCKMFVELVKRRDVDAEQFFAAPLQFIDHTTRVLVRNSHCVDLFKALVKSDGELDISSISDEKLRQDTQTAALELIGSYLKKVSGVVMFAHPSVYESVITALYERDSVFILENTNLSVLIQKVNIKQSDQVCLDGYINVDPLPEVVNILCQRLRPQLLIRDFSVFEYSRFCESSAFCEQLVQSSVRKSRRSFGIFKQDKRKIYINELNEEWDHHSGNTMLHTAVRNGNFTAARILIEHGADVNKTNKAHITVETGRPLSL